MFGLGAQELLLILVIILVLFGAKRIPEMARGLGKSLSEFKKGVKEVDQEVRESVNGEPNSTSGSGDSQANNQASKE